MKTILTIIILLTFWTTGISQNTSDKELMDFIKNEGQYIRLTDKNNLPETVTKYENEIYKTIKKKKIKIEDALVLVTYIKTDSTSLQIPIFDISGFKKDLESYKQRTKDGYYTRTVGNASGKDGVVVIDTIKRKAIRYMYFQ